MSLLIPYRPDIDGLRAIAVLAVVLYHANIEFLEKFKGGFLGVDVFFVISGFLITQILLKELMERRFSLASFYERRIRRILPLLFTVKLVSIPFAWLLMMPRSMYEYSASILSSLVFSSNIWFSFDQDYWAADNALKPFLHTWSLSVEEQYYLIFPLLLWGAWKCGRTFLVGLFCIIFIVSLFWAQIWSADNPAFSFYLLPTRFWEMLAGSMAAIYVVLFSKDSRGSSNWLLSTTGLVIIISSMFYFNSETLHPSLFTLVPIIGTCLVLTFPNNRAVAYRLLSTKFMVQLGLLSYGAYLWHYPIFAFSQMSELFVGTTSRLMMIIVTFVLSFVTYHLIEQPFRKRTKMTFKQILLILSLFTAMLLSFNTYSVLNNGNVGRFSESQLKFLGMAQGENEEYSKYVTERYNNDVEGKPFSKSDRPKVLLIGDSFSQDLYNVLLESGLANQVEIVTRYLPSTCRNVPQRLASQAAISPKRKQRCLRVARVGHPAIRDVIVNSDLVLVASNWGIHTTKMVLELQKELYAEGASNVLFIGAKRLPNVTVEEVLANNNDSIVSLRKRIDSSYYQGILKMRQKGLDNYFDIQTLMCGDDSDLCRIATKEGFPISYDTYHLSKWGAIELGELLIEDPVFMGFWRKSLALSK